MNDLSERLRFLVRQSRTATTALLAPVLDHARADECDGIAKTLLNQGDVTALAAVLRNLHRISADCRDQVVASPADLGAAATRCLEHSDDQILKNLLDLAADRLDWRLAPVLAAMLDGADESIDRSAGERLLDIVVHTIGSAGRRSPSSDGMARTLDRAISLAGQRFRDHRSVHVLVATALMSASPGPRLSAMLADPDHPVVVALRGVAGRLDLSIVRRNLVNWLHHEHLCRSVLRWYHTLKTAEQHSDALESGHLLLLPTRRRALRRLDRPVRCLPPLDDAIAMSPAAQSWLPFLVAGLPLSSERRLACLQELVALPAPTARLKAVRLLARQASPGATASLVQFTRDASEPTAHAAAVEVLTNPGSPSSDSITHLEHSAHRCIADRARARNAAVDVSSYFGRWRQIGPALRVALAHRFLAADRLAFREHLRVRLTGGERGEALATIMMVRRLALANNLAVELFALTEHPDARVASAAIAALADIRGTDRHVPLRKALQHSNTRARANAVEALGANVRPEGLRILASLLDSRDNRTRANVVRAMLSHAPDRAVPCLLQMLDDPDPMHRISGIWVARRSQAIPVADQLKRMASSDRAPLIRARAGVAHRILRFNLDHPAMASHAGPAITASGSS